MAARLLYLLILFLMGINGALFLSFFLSPPNPDKIGIWFMVVLFIFPLLGLLGLFALVRSKALNLSKWVGTHVLLYVVPLLFLINSSQLGFPWILNSLPQGSFETLSLVLYVASLTGLLSFMPTLLRKNS